MCSREFACSSAKLPINGAVSGPPAQGCPIESAPRRDEGFPVTAHHLNSRVASAVIESHRGRGEEQAPRRIARKATKVREVAPQLGRRAGQGSSMNE